MLVVLRNVIILRTLPNCYRINKELETISIFSYNQLLQTLETATTTLIFIKTSCKSIGHNKLHIFSLHMCALRRMCVAKMARLFDDAISQSELTTSDTRNPDSSKFWTF